MIRFRRGAEETSVDARQTRVRLLSAELGELRVAAADRTKSLDNKASFLVIAAGVLLTATGLGLVSADTWYTGLLPVTLLVGTILTATIALWPRPTNLPSARKVVDTWVDSKLTGEQLEDHLLEVRAKEIDNRDNANERRANQIKLGFGLLVASVFSGMGVVCIDAVVRG